MAHDYKQGKSADATSLSTPPAPPGAAHVQIELGAPAPSPSAQQLGVDPRKKEGNTFAKEGKKRASAVKKYLALLSYTTPFDVMLFLGDILDANASFLEDSSFGSLQSATIRSVLVITYIGVSAFGCAYLMSSLLNWAGARVASRIRLEYLAALLRQDAAWYDTTTVSAHVARLSADINTIQTGISFKAGVVLQYTSTFLTGVVVAFVKGPKLAAVIVATVPVIAGSAIIMTSLSEKWADTASTVLSDASGVAQEVLASIKTVISFNGQERAVERYRAFLKKAEKNGIFSEFATALGGGLVMGCVFGMLALAFFYGSLQINHGMTAGGVLNTLFALLIGAMSLTNLSPNIASMSSAAAVSEDILETIRRKSPIDSSSNKGLRPATVHGVIEFHNVDFSYPQRPDVPVLRNFSLRIEPGQSVGLVGLSGSGKSTIINLLLRFYDPTAGYITLDGTDLRSLNVAWLRQQIAAVRQEPNLLYGLRDDAPTLDAFDATVVDSELEVQLGTACKLANAWDFISSLPQGLDTAVGEVGSRMSGGQKNPNLVFLKQRIAIARAVLRDPSILLLDEATSGHCIRTLMASDKIIEQGTHESLLVIPDGTYASLVSAQGLGSTSSYESEHELAGTAVLDDVLEESAPANEALEGVVMPEKEKDAATVLTAGNNEAGDENVKALMRKIPIGRLVKLCVEDAQMYLLGCLAGLVEGAVFPVFALLFSSVLVALEKSDDDKRNHDIAFWCLMYVVLAATIFLGQTGAGTAFGAAGQLEAAFFDGDHASSAVLSARLAEDAKLIKELIGKCLHAFVTASSTVICGLAIAFPNGPLLTLVVLALLPLIASGEIIEVGIITGAGEKIQKLYEESAVVATESIRHILTVMTLTKERVFFEKYKTKIQSPLEVSIRGSFAAAFGYAVSQSVVFFTFAICFYTGVELVGKGLMGVDAVLKVIFEVIFTAMALGQAASEAPDIARGRLAVLAVFDLMDRRSTIDPASREGHTAVAVSGKVELKDVFFRFPALDGLTVKAEPGQTVALVGQSGCGKSTVIGMLQRMHDAHKGLVAIDDVSVPSWNVINLRSHLSLEPTLFNLSIADNIAYGARGGVASMDEVVAAARLANIHNFALSLPEGYNTVVGSQGGQLSGGQRQRVAIARALIGNPRILLLDVATSALDSESETLVQEALERAAKGRTTVIIAHRLSTIRGANHIYVLDAGSRTWSAKVASSLAWWPPRISASTTPRLIQAAIHQPRSLLRPVGL
ncbi:hypothetical protein HK405_013340 [Cladochytrium tenue]|nr:hypothetical protein HK405_013340 [Cladochytrium tenue]